ncbi:flavin reductase family protein [Romboutsia sedimentorum]|uniref:Flavin reductase family protein n=1 Tax=Romboutsia sedimentorum TaxID=1368474 RepID=A0ABT7EAE0_9FIRM|nr:flavin reductase family protein [Romboutsia sedimentorum]MDK2563885.1 flavin reductase family protein [Romboutsia sedimentorum]MDK2585375.1 flavin reductase family protein [Romboutsia sedimentorum]
MYKEVNFTEISKELLDQLQNGAFLTVKAGDTVNTMTITWGSLGFIWYKPTFTAMVRYSRYTYELIEKAEDFTVSLPLNGQLKKELDICGTKSGKDVDKFAQCNITLKEGEVVKSPIINECDLHIECKILYKQPMDENAVCQEIKDKSYSNGDYHTLYYAEIVKAYIKS